MHSVEETGLGVRTLEFLNKLNPLAGSSFPIPIHYGRAMIQGVKGGL
jgi:hypothetical protein